MIWIPTLKAWLDPAIFGLLGLMSLLWLWAIIERWWFYRGLKGALMQFATIESLTIALTENLTLIATVASNAPYVGLLGTVLGVLVAFFDLAQGGKFDTAAVMLGLAFALKATAAGITLAIFGMFSYNALNRKVEVLTLRWQEVRKLQK
jgi:biopolymer transport protein ExbB